MIINAIFKFQEGHKKYLILTFYTCFGGHFIQSNKLWETTDVIRWLPTNALCAIWICGISAVAIKTFYFGVLQCAASKTMIWTFWKRQGYHRWTYVIQDIVGLGWLTHAFAIRPQGTVPYVACCTHIMSTITSSIMKIVAVSAVFHLLMTCCWERREEDLSSHLSVKDEGLMKLIIYNVIYYGLFMQQ